MTPAEAARLTRQLFDEHNLVGWKVTFGNAKRIAGTCSQHRKVITYSKYLLAQRSYEDSFDVVTHEVAHAIVGARHGHDRVWQAQHRALGGNGKRCFAHVDEQSPIVGRCPHGKEFARYRMPKRPDAWSCRCRKSAFGGPSGKIVWSKRAV
jgi:hypothetical protein